MSSFSRWNVAKNKAYFGLLFFEVILAVVGFFNNIYKLYVLNYYLSLFIPFPVVYYLLDILKVKKKFFFFFSLFLTVLSVVIVEFLLKTKGYTFLFIYKNTYYLTLLSIVVTFVVLMYATLLLVLKRLKSEKKTRNLPLSIDIAISLLLLGELADSLLCLKYFSIPYKPGIAYPISLLFIYTIQNKFNFNYNFFKSVTGSKDLAVIIADEHLNIVKASPKACKILSIDDSSQPEKVHIHLPDEIVFTKEKYFSFAYLSEQNGKKIEGTRILLGSSEHPMFVYTMAENKNNRKISFKNLLPESSYNKIFSSIHSGVKINELRIELWKLLSDSEIRFEKNIKRLLELTSDFMGFDAVTYFYVQNNKSIKCKYESNKMPKSSLDLEIPSFIIKPFLNEEPKIFTAKSLINSLPSINKTIAKPIIWGLWNSFSLEYIITIPIKYKNKIVGVIMLDSCKGNDSIKPQWSDELKVLVNDVREITEQLIINDHEKQSKERDTQALKESEEKYRNIFEHLHDVYFRTDKTGNITLISPSSLSIFGEKAVKLIGKNIVTDFFINYEAQELFLKKLDSEGYISEFEVEIKNQRAEKVWISINANYFMDEHGRIMGIEGMCRNISERKSLEEQLIRSERVAAVGTLAGGLAHEFNNINMTILGYAEFGLLKQNLSEETAHYFQTIRKSAKRAENITKHLLTFATNKSVRLKSGNLTTVVEDTCVMMEHELRKNKIKLIKHLKPLPSTVMNSHQLGQVIMNLLINAQHALIDREKKEITITTGFDDSNVYVEISDTGCGIEKKNLQKIFSPFFTTKGEHADKEDPMHKVKGTGLGLSVSQTIINNHKGDISVTSKVGEGTTFKITIPIVREYKHPDSSPSFTSFHDAPSAKILIVDDEPDLRELLSSFLEEQGHQVLCADEKQNIINYITENKPDVLLLDLNVPGLQTSSLLHFISDLDIELRPVVLLMTGQTNITEQPESVFDIIYKPFNLDTLSVFIRKATIHRLEIIKHS